MKQVAVDPETGADFKNNNSEPRIRAASGLDSAAALWGRSVPLWNPLIDSLSMLGYSPKNIFMQSYDWHLSLEALESRDGFFSALMHTIESAYNLNGQRKVVLVCHSLGGVIFLWLSQFALARDPVWMDTYVHASVLLGAPLLGAPKAIMTAWTSIMRHLESLMYLLPKGDDEFWGRYTWEKPSTDLDLSRLLSQSTKMNHVINSDYCAGASATSRGLNVESVFGNVSRLLSDLKVLLHFLHIAECFLFSNSFVPSRCSWTAAETRNTKAKQKPSTISSLTWKKCIL
jgi:hypothetical protein